MVVNGAGSAAIACVELIKRMGMPSDNVIMCDTRGVIYRGREAGMNQWKSGHAVDTELRTLAEAMVGADVFLGVSAKGAVTREMVGAMADKPIIFAMANPDPEITPEDVAAVRTDAIMATGRSDYPNQINNVLGFPYIFRGALDVRASTINDEMKIAAARALAELAREDVPDEVDAAYAGHRLKYGPQYLIPTPFDPRLIVAVPEAVARAAMDSGVARRPIVDMGAYRNELSARPSIPPPEACRRSSTTSGPIRARWCSPRERRRRASARPTRSAMPVTEPPFSSAARTGSTRPLPSSACRTRKGSRSTTRGSAPGPGPTWTFSMRGCSARGPCFGTVSAWSTRTGTCSAPAWSRSATRTPW